MNDLKKQLEAATGHIDLSELKEAKATIHKILKLAEADQIENAKRLEDLEGKVEGLANFIQQLALRVDGIEDKPKGGKHGN